MEEVFQRQTAWLKCDYHRLCDNNNIEGISFSTGNKFVLLLKCYTFIEYFKFGDPYPIPKIISAKKSIATHCEKLATKHPTKVSMLVVDRMYFRPDTSEKLPSQKPPKIIPV